MRAPTLLRAWLIALAAGTCASALAETHGTASTILTFTSTLSGEQPNDFADLEDIQNLTATSTVYASSSRRDTIAPGFLFGYAKSQVVPSTGQFEISANAAGEFAVTADADFPPYPANTETLQTRVQTRFFDRIVFTDDATDLPPSGEEEFGVTVKFNFSFQGQDSGNGYSQVELQVLPNGSVTLKDSQSGLFDGSAQELSCQISGFFGKNGFRPVGSSTARAINLSVSATATAGFTRYVSKEQKGDASENGSNPNLVLTSVEFLGGPEQDTPYLNPHLKMIADSGYVYHDFGGQLFQLLDFAANEFFGWIEAADAVAQTIEEAIKEFNGSVKTTLTAARQTKAASTDPQPLFNLSTQLAIGAGTFGVKGHVYADGHITFLPGDTATRTLPLKGGGQLVLALSLANAASDHPQIVGTLTNPATGHVANITADLAQYHTTRTATAALPAVPAAMLGSYTFALPPSATQTLAADQFPSGAGIGHLTVASAGHVQLTGNLADGGKLTCGGIITKGGECFLFAPLYDKGGYVAGKLTFRDVAASDFDSSSLHWVRPAGVSTALYPSGWPTGVTLTAKGSKYTLPPRAPAVSVFPSLGATSATGNAIAALSGAALPDQDATDNDPATPLRHGINIATNNRITIATPGADKLALSLVKSTGMLSGSFVFPGTTKKTALHGVVLQKSAEAAGYFLTPTSGGAVSVSKAN